MATAITLNRAGIQPTGEPIPVGGPIYFYSDGVALAGVVQTAWLDVAAWGDIHIEGLTVAGFGTLVVEWSIDASVAHFTTAPPLPVLAAGVPYDSGAIVPLAQWMRVTYTQGGVLTPSLILSILAAAGAGGGGIGPVVVNVNLLGQVESLPAADPASVRSASAALLLLEEPDHALRTRARALTDEGSFDGVFPGASLYRPIAGGNLTLAFGSTAWSRVAATTPIRVGDYVELVADHNDAVPVMAQVDTITAGSGGLAGTLRTAYQGAGGAGPGQVSDWWAHCETPGVNPPSITVAGGAVKLNPNVDNGAHCTIARRFGAGGRKDFAPLWARFLLAVSAARANQACLFGLTGDPTAAASQLAAFSPKDAVATTLHLLTSPNAATLPTQDETAVMPAGGWTDADPHLYDVMLLEDQANFFVDRQRVNDPDTSKRYGQGLIPDPYDDLWVQITIVNNAGVGGPTDLTVLDAQAKALNFVDARVVQPDGAKLHMTVDAMPAVAVNVDLQGRVESRPAPAPAAVPSALADLNPLAEPDGALRTRARALTDEDSFAGNFPGASLYTAVNGGMTLTTGSNVWARANTVTPLAVGDYVEITADHSDLVPVMEQIETINAGGLSGTLRANYVGAGGALAAAQRSDWLVHCTAAAGDGIAVAGGGVVMSLGNNAGSRVGLARRLGGGGRKAYLPLLARFLLTVDAIGPNRQLSFGLASDLNIVAGTMTQLAGFVPLTATTVNLNNYVDVAAMLGNSKTVAPPDGGNVTDGTPHLYEVVALEDRADFYINRYPLVGQDDLYQQGIVPTPYQDLWLFVGLATVNAPGGATNLTVYDARSKSFDALDARVTQPDAGKLHVTPARSPRAVETTVAAAAADTSLLAANVRRVGFEVRNDADKLMYLAFGAVATTAAVTRVNPGSSYYDTFRYTGQIKAIWEAGVVGNARIRELTA